MTRLAESTLGQLLPLHAHRRPPDIRRVSQEPVFGRALYEMLGRARIVLNGAIDMAGEDRGNMRCFEAMGCGALLVSDAGRYPEGMVDAQTMRTYASAAEAIAVIDEALAAPNRLRTMAREGHGTVVQRYAKAGQWHDFKQLVG